MAAKKLHQQRYLQMEIAEIILLKLPSKSLLRFQTLSKSYMALIRDPCFSRNHLELSRKNNNSNSFLVMRAEDEGHYYFLAKFEGEKFQPEKKVGQSPVGSRYRAPLCCCDDTVLFGGRMKNGNGDYLLWNPINNTHHRATQSPPFNQSLLNYGLCHDKTEDDYKIVLVSCMKRYAVYSCKHGTWTAIKKVENECLSLSFRGVGSGVFIDGKLYWVGRQRDLKWVVICFDPLSDSLNEHKIPQEDFEFQFHPFLINLRGCVCLGGDVRSKDVIQIWMLRGGGSWEKTICIHKRSLANQPVYNLACYVVGDEIVIWTANNGNYIINTLEERLVWSGKTCPLENSKLFPQPLVLSLRSFLT